MKLEHSRQLFEKYSNMKFHENPFSVSRLFHSDGRTNGQTDMTNLIVSFRNFTNISKMTYREQQYTDRSPTYLLKIIPVKWYTFLV